MFTINGIRPKFIKFNNNDVKHLDVTQNGVTKRVWDKEVTSLLVYKDGVFADSVGGFTNGSQFGYKDQYNPVPDTYWGYTASKPSFETVNKHNLLYGLNHLECDVIGRYGASYEEAMSGINMKIHIGIFKPDGTLATEWVSGGFSNWHTSAMTKKFKCTHDFDLIDDGFIRVWATASDNRNATIWINNLSLVKK